MTKDLFDEDGYPSPHALEEVAKWPYTDPKGWLAFIKELWYMPDWGWKQFEGTNRQDENITIYEISTAGWSGNEDIIRAMEKNKMLWFFTWYSSRRGGHYRFEVEND